MLLLLLAESHTATMFTTILNLLGGEAALDSWVAETCAKEAAVSIAPPVLCS